MLFINFACNLTLCNRGSLAAHTVNKKYNLLDESKEISIP